MSRYKQYRIDELRFNAIRNQRMSAIDHGMVDNSMEYLDHDSAIWWQNYRAKSAQYARESLWQLIDMERN